MAGEFVFLILLVANHKTTRLLVAVSHMKTLRSQPQVSAQTAKEICLKMI
jgi:hypothetical protein